MHWRSRWREVFSIDLRTLALFRFALGSVLAVDMVNRFEDLSAFYTDWGLMPRAWVETLNGPLRISLHLVSGDAWFAGLLLAVEGLAALAFALGYRTRVAAALAFLLEASLLNRNPMILLGADTLIVCLLFWSMFVPVNARWSVDAALAPNAAPQDPRHFSAGSVGLILQVLCVYFFSAILKSGSQWWPDGTAVYYTMSLDRYSSPLGRELLNYPSLMQGLSWFVYWLERVGPLFALSPFLQAPLRFIVMLALMAMHVGFIFCMEIGLFPWVSLSSLTVLLGSWWWNWAARRVDHRQHLKIYYDGDCGFCLKSCLLLRHLLVLPRTEIFTAQSSVRAHALMQAQYSWVVIDGEDVAHTRWDAFVALLRHSLLFGWLAPLAGLKIWERPGVWTYQWVARHRAAFGKITAFLLPARETRFEAPAAAQAIAAAFAIFVVAWNVVTIERLPMSVAHFLEPLMLPLRIDQSWPMFAPHPSEDDGWYIIPGVLEDGSEIDVNTRKPLEWNRPDNIAATEPNVRWRTYHTLIWNRELAENRGYYARWLCRDWNTSAPAGRHLMSLKIIYMLEHTPPPGGTTAIEQHVLWRHECLAKSPPESGPGSAPADEPTRPKADLEHKRPV